ncbi:four helix bundle protein [Geobacter sp. SVR]|uniref:four helix bundle protein n=1 Tax=Geobacter sp. SVR TaxID=2495594 RepID=UPI00156779C1|nr:four helix bundle protein [Geobacter sp. SVR]
MRDHKDLEVWQLSIDLVKEVYELTRRFPKEELFGLTAQMRRAAVSIPSNISEGAARQTGKEFIQFLFIALGSASELETQIIISEKLNYLQNSDQLLMRLSSLKKLLNGLIRYYRSKMVTHE